MWCNTMVSAFSIAVVVERFYVLFLLYRGNIAELIRMIDQATRTGSVPKANMDLLNKHDHHPIIHLALSYLLSFTRRARTPLRFVEDRLFETYLEVQPLIRRRTHHLPMLANVATLVGLLGTILGLIDTFSGMAHADPAQKQALLAGGIAMAMNNTAYGLLVAIPNLVFAAIFEMRESELSHNLDLVYKHIKSFFDDPATRHRLESGEFESKAS
jgi:biopolymer transport protein ExbB/TolQ